MNNSILSFILAKNSSENNVLYRLYITHEAYLYRSELYFLHFYSFTGEFSAQDG